MSPPTSHHQSLPQGPKQPPLVQQWQWIFKPIDYMQTASKQYPDIFTAKIAGSLLGPIVFVNHPQGVQQLLTQDQKQFSAPGQLNQILAPLLGNQSVILLDGEPHKRQRQLLMPPFHGERMRSYSDLIWRITQTVFNAIPVGQTFMARTLTQEISLQVILEAVFGLGGSTRLQPVKELLVSILNTFSSPIRSSVLFFPALQKDLGPWSPWGWFQRQRQQLDDLLYAEIHERRAAADPDRSDILSLLLAARDEHGEPMSDQELRDELMTLLVAGHETTATSLAWALYWIHRQPEIKTKLMTELQTAIPDLKSLSTQPPEDLIALTRLPYLTALCQETLRIYPVALVTLPRVVEDPVELMGYHLDPETIVMACIYLTHHRPDLYPNPDQFQPERFLERSFSPYEYLPFGGGSRRCIGMALAMVEMKLALAAIMSQYDLALCSSREEHPQRRGLTLASETGIKMVLQAQYGS